MMGRRRFFTQSIRFSRLRIAASHEMVLALLVVFCASPSRSHAQPPASVTRQEFVSAPDVRNGNAPVVDLSPEQYGDLLMARGRYAAALQQYRDGVLTSASLWNKVGVAYHHLFAYDEAIQAYKMALTIDPRFAPALNNLGAVYHTRHNYKQAVKTYKQALKWAPRSASIYRNLGTSYFAEAKYALGVKAYQTAMSLDPEVFTVDQGAIESTSSRPQLIEMYYSLAKVFAAAQNFAQAMQNLRKAYDEGFRDRKRLAAEKTFASLRTTPEFQKFVSEASWY